MTKDVVFPNGNTYQITVLSYQRANILFTRQAEKFEKWLRQVAEVMGKIPADASESDKALAAQDTPEPPFEIMEFFEALYDKLEASLLKSHSEQEVTEALESFPVVPIAAPEACVGAIKAICGF